MEIVVRDADTVAAFDRWGKELWRRSPVIESGVPVPAGRVGMVSSAELADFNGDGAGEILLVTGSDDPQGWSRRAPQHVIVFDSGGQQVLRKVPVFDGGHANPGKCFDFNGDGRIDIVFHTGTYRHPHAVCIYDFSDGQQLHVIDANMQRVSTVAGENSRVAATNDLNGDGEVEIVVWQNAELVVLRGDLTELARFSASGPIHEAIVTDIDSAGINEVILRSGTGEAVGVEVVRLAPQDETDDVDLAEPAGVVRAFLAEVRARHTDRAVEHALPSKRPDIRSVLESGKVATFPAAVKFALRVHVDDAHVDVDREPRIHLKMGFSEDRWWITGISWGTPEVP